MTPQEKTLLYYFNLMTDTEGESRVERSHIAGFIGCTKQTADKRIKGLVDSGLIECHKVGFAPGRGHGYKYQYHITIAGLAAIDENREQARALFNLFQGIRMDEILKRARRIGNKITRTKKRNEHQLELL